MNNRPEEIERYEKSVDRAAKDVPLEHKNRIERSPGDTVEMNQSTGHQGNYSREANITNVPSRSIDKEQTPSEAKEPKEQDRDQKAYEKEIIQSAYVDKVNRPPKEPPKRPVEVLRMLKKVFHEIRRTIGSLPVETGGLLMGSIEDFQVSGFIFDNVSFKTRRRSAVWYPHTESLNEQVETCERKGLVFLGVVHSHPRGCIRPSGPDETAAWSNMTSPNNIHLNTYLLPIIQSAVDGPFEYRSYIATCHPEGQGRVIVQRIKLRLVD